MIRNVVFDRINSMKINELIGICIKNIRLSYFIIKLQCMKYIRESFNSAINEDEVEVKQTF